MTKNEVVEMRMLALQGLRLRAIGRELGASRNPAPCYLRREVAQGTVPR